MSSAAELAVFGGMVREFADNYVFDLSGESSNCPRAITLAEKYTQLGVSDSAIRLARRAACLEAISFIATLTSSIQEITADATAE